MSDTPKPISLFDRARLAISNALRPKAYMGAWESARQSVHRTRVDAPNPTDFRLELTDSVRREMVRLSRWLEKNNGLFRQIISDTAIYTVGDGIMMQANGGDFDWQSLVEAEWDQECESPEVTGRFSLLESLYIICEALDRDGEIFIIKAKRNGIPKFQLVETHRVETPHSMVNDYSINDGIKYNKYGVPVVYYVKQTDGGYTPVPASAMMHVYNPTHASASRAYPPHQHAITNLRDEMDLLSMEKVAAKDNARISRILKTNDLGPDNGDIGLGVPNNSTTPTNTTEMNRILGGVTAVLQPNEELISHQSARPTTAFTGFIEHLRRDSCLGSLPFEFLADPTKAGGASVRLVVAKAGRYFSHRQNIIIKRFLNPYFQYWLGTKINRGDLPSARNWWKVEWMTPRSVTVDAGRDAVSDRADLEMGRTTIEDDFAARGYQYEKTMRKRAKNFLFLEKLAKDTGLSRDDLFRFSPQGGMEGAAGNKPALDKDGNPLPDESGKNPLIEEGLEYEDIKDTVGELEPETSQPDVGTGVTPIVRNETPVDALPKQNIGRSRPVDQSFVG